MDCLNQVLSVASDSAGDLGGETITVMDVWKTFLKKVCKNAGQNGVFYIYING